MSVGMALAQAVPISGDRSGTGKSIRHFFQKFFTTRGELPADVYAANVRREGRIAKEMNALRFAAADFKRGIRAALKGKDLSQADVEKMNAVLRGEAELSTVPEEVRTPIQAFRDHIDSLSRQLIAEGVAQGDLVGIITENEGVYATRSYRIFDDPKHRDKVPVGVRNRAIAAIREMYPEKTDAEVIGTLESLLYRGAAESPVALIKGSKLGSKDLSSFIARKDIPVWLRDLWGEYKDAGVNYARSIFKMSHLIANHQFLNEVRDAGLGTWLRTAEDGPIVNEYGEVITKIAADESSVMAPLNGLYTTPEIKAAFEKFGSQANMPDWLRAIMAVNYAIKYGKTVGSAMTHIRNFISNGGFAVQNGHWRLDKAGAATWATATGTWKLNNAKFRSYYNRLVELKLAGEDVRSGELKDACETLPRWILTNTCTIYQRDANRLSKAMAKGWPFQVLIPSRRCRFGRSMRGRMNKPDTLRHILNGRRISWRTYGANIVRDTYPTYSKIPEGIKAIRRFPSARSIC